MKILYPVINGDVSGGNMIALSIIEGAIKKGYEVFVSSPTEGEFTRILREKGVKVYNIDLRRSFRFDNAIRLARIIRKEGIGLVHTHTPLGGVIWSRMAGWMAGVPVITHAHTYDFISQNPLIRTCQFLLNRLTSRFLSARIIAVSENVKKEIIKQGAMANKITVIHNGIDLDGSRQSQASLRIRNEFGLKENQQIIGNIARLCKDKGQHILIKAMQKVVKRNTDIILMVVGEDLQTQGQYLRGLRELADNLEVGAHVIFTGYRSDIMNLMSAFEFFVLPSLVEGLSVVILEAMAAKKTVITTSVGGNPEIVIDKETGTLVPPEDPDKLAEAIIYHLENYEVSKNMGEKGYERVRQFFPLSGMLDRVMDIYKEVLR